MSRRESSRVIDRHRLRTPVRQMERGGQYPGEHYSSSAHTLCKLAGEKQTPTIVFTFVEVHSFDILNFRSLCQHAAR